MSNNKKKKLFTTIGTAVVAAVIAASFVPVGIAAEYTGETLYENDVLAEDSVKVNYKYILPFYQKEAKDLNASIKEYADKVHIDVKSGIYSTEIESDYVKLDKVSVSYGKTVYEGDDLAIENVSAQAVYADKTTREVKELSFKDDLEPLLDDEEVIVKTEYGEGKLQIDVQKVKSVDMTTSDIIAGEEASKDDIEKIILVYDDDAKLDVTDKIEDLVVPEEYKAGANIFSFKYKSIGYSTEKNAQLYTQDPGVSMYTAADADSEYITSIPLSTALDVESVDDGWAKVSYEGDTGYIRSGYLSGKKAGPSYEPLNGWPLTYEDGDTKITVTREWYENAWCYIAHIQMSPADYNRFGTVCGNNSYGSTETTSHCAERIGAVLCVNGDYSAPSLNYAVKRSGSVKHDKACTVPGVYNAGNGCFMSPNAAGCYGMNVSSSSITDTFCFGPAFLEGGSITCSSGGSRAQRTFMGTNGNAGDIYLVVSDGRMNDGESSGLTGYQCAALLKSKGCTFGIPLDGGGSSLMCWKDNDGLYHALNANRKNERAVVDFVYFK